MTAACAPSGARPASSGSAAERRAARTQEWLELIVGRKEASQSDSGNAPIRLERWEGGLRYFVLPGTTPEEKGRAEAAYWSAERFARKLSDAAVDGMPIETHAEEFPQATLVIAVGDSIRRLADSPDWGGFVTLATATSDATAGLTGRKGAGCLKLALTTKSGQIVRGLIRIPEAGDPAEIDHCIAAGFLYALGVQGETSRSPSVKNTADPSLEPEFVDRDAFRILYGPGAAVGMDLRARIKTYAADAILPAD
jgi:hypothetical protein